MTVKIFGENTGDDFTGITEDTRLVQFSATTQTYNYGIETILFLGHSSAAFAASNGLIRFDISGLVGGATISSALISLEHKHGSCLSHSASSTIDLHEILVANNNWWPEGTKNGTAAAAGEPNWDEKKSGSVSWAGGSKFSGNDGCNISGTDFNATAADSQAVSTGATTITFDVTSEVQTQYSSGNNYGFTLRTNSGTAYVAFDSSEGTDGSRPIMTITYTLAATSLRALNSYPLRALQIIAPERALQIYA